MTFGPPERASSIPLNSHHFPAAGPATGSFNGLHPKNKFLAVLVDSLWVGYPEACFGFVL
jgi:hypothetical protein